ncbi:MAG: type II toxin-antitoxin system RelE/ParE family toxin [Patescibacteria group bacterium]
MMNKWKVLLHQSVIEFLKSIPEKDETRITQLFRLLKDLGPSIREPHSKPLSGFRGLFELRKESDKKVYRVFYFRDGLKFVLIHIYRKQSSKTSLSDMRLAKRRMEEYFKNK